MQGFTLPNASRVYRYVLHDNNRGQDEKYKEKVQRNIALQKYDPCCNHVRAEKSTLSSFSKWDELDQENNWNKRGGVSDNLDSWKCQCQLEPQL